MRVVDADRDFAEFVSRHEGDLRSIVAHRLRDLPDDVDDALQEGLMRIWREFPSFPSDPKRRTAYAGQLLNRASIDLVRGRFGRHMQRRDQHVRYEPEALDRPGEAEREQVLVDLQRVLDRMQAELAGDEAGSEELERRLEALRLMFPALKPLERDVLLAHHPAGGNRRSPEVAKRLGLTHSQVRQLYMEAMATLRPLLAHALAPGLDADEAGRVLDYTAGTMTDKRQRGRMKRHLKHCAACRALIDSQSAVVATGAHLVLPLPGFVGLASAAAGTAAIGTSVAAGGGGGGGAAAGGGILSGLAAKAATGAAALTVAAGGYTAVEHEVKRHPERHKRQAVAEVTPTPTATAEPVSTATAAPQIATPTPEPTAPPATPTPTPAATATATQEPVSGPSEPPPVTSASGSTASAATPPPHKTSSSTAKSFAQEFGP